MDTPQPKGPQPTDSNVNPQTGTISPDKKEPTATEKGCGLLVIVLVVAWSIKSCFFAGGISDSELKDAPVALEKLAREVFDSEAGIESIKVERMGPNESSYSIHIAYHAFFVLNEKATLNSIQVTMEKGYRELLKYPQLPVSYIKVAAQLELQDKYGNKKGWSDVYRTELSRDTIQKLNREDLDGVMFARIWEVVYRHPMFWGAEK